MSELAERSDWYRGKEPIFDEMTENRNAMLSGTAARGFNAIPGYLIGGMTTLEVKTKKALSNLNYEVVARAVEREMVQQGINYNLAHKNSVIEWEIDKAQLMDALTRELAEARRVREQENFALASLAIEVGLRQVALINAKRILDLEAEDIKKEIADLEGRTSTKELELARAKLATAERKMAIIPYLQKIITAEEDLLVSESANTVLLQELLELEEINIGHKKAVLTEQEKSLPHKQAIIDGEEAEIPLKKSLLGVEKANQTHKETLMAAVGTHKEAQKTLIAAEAYNISYQQAILEVKDSTIEKKDGLMVVEELNTDKRKQLAEKSMESLPVREQLIKLEEWNQGFRDALINARFAQIPIKEDVLGLKDHLLSLKKALIAPAITIAERKKALADARLEYETKAKEKIATVNELVTAMAELNAAMKIQIDKQGSLVDPYLQKAAKLSELIALTHAYTDELTRTVPHIQALAIEKMTLIDPALAKAGALRTLIAPMVSKATGELEYARKIEANVTVEREIKYLAKSMEELNKTAFDAEMAVMEKRLAEGDLQKQLIDVDLALRRLESANRSLLINEDAQDTSEYLTVKEIAQTAVIEKEKEAVTSQVDSSYAVAIKRLEASLESVKTNVDAVAGREGSIEEISKINRDARVATAEASAAAQITSSLIHQIS
jgi:hypothetical protein